MREENYQAMRNNKTFASYKAWSKSVRAKSQPLVGFSVLSLTFGGLIEGRAMMNGSLFLSLSGCVLLMIGAGCQVVGWWKAARYRKANPWMTE